MQPVSAVPANLRLANQTALLGQLLGRKAASRAELAKATGMSKPTTGKIIDDLDARRRRRGDQVARRRPPQRRPARQAAAPRHQPVPLRRHRSGRRDDAHLGPAAVAARQERWEVQFKTPTSADAWQEKVAQSAEKIQVKRPWAVMVSTPGVVDERAGRVLLSPNLHWSEHADLPWILRQIWSAPVGLVQEVRALALGELGARPDGDDFIMVDIADGVGGALMLGGRIYQGALPMSGEIGHTPIPGNNRLCGCGGRGCLETLASQRGMIQSLREAKGYPATQNLTFADVVKATERELPPWMRATFDAIATCVSAALNLYGVRRVVMVGRITELPPPATDYLIGVIQRASMWSRFDAVAVTLAPKRIARGLVIAGIHRFVMPADWSVRH